MCVWLTETCCSWGRRALVCILYMCVLRIPCNLVKMAESVPEVSSGCQKRQSVRWSSYLYCLFSSFSLVQGRLEGGNNLSQYLACLKVITHSTLVYGSLSDQIYPWAYFRITSKCTPWIYFLFIWKILSSSVAVTCIKFNFCCPKCNCNC